MNQILGFVVGLLQSALSLLGFVQTHPDLPQAQHDQAVQVAQQAITQATNAIASNSVQSSMFSAIPTSGAVPLTVSFAASGLDSSRDYIIFFATGGQGYSNIYHSVNRINLQHIYNSPGTYIASLVADPGLGQTTIAMVKVTVTDGSQ